MTDLTLPPSEFAARRRRLRTVLRQAVGAIFAGEQTDPLHDDFRPHPHFLYLTGVRDEPGAVLVLDPGHPLAARREMLFLRPLEPEREQWDGLRPPLSETLKQRIGVKSIFRTTHLPRILGDSLRRARSAACLHPLARYDEPVSPDLAILQRCQQRIPGLEIVDHSEAVARLRSVKSAAEIRLISKAVKITAAGFEAAIRGVRPGLGEFQVQEMIEHAYRTQGSRGPAFGTIVGSGMNSTVLHYRANDQTIGEEDVVCIDSGASFGGYGGDITRTIPASGRFTKRQKQVYQVVLRALQAATRAVRPGATLDQVDRAARGVISRAGFGDHFIHSIGHHLGLETHDVTPAGALRAGNVITIEPGIYIPQERIGIRIEDDVVVTTNGCRNLSAGIPKSVAAIEGMMKEGT
jgi:Xaa-Pro aminopeptidase